MQTIKFNLTGSRIDIETALAEIAALPDVNAVDGTPKPLVGTVFTRPRQNQVELFECIVQVVIGVASSAFYDGVKVAIAEIARKRNIESTKVEGESNLE